MGLFNRKQFADTVFVNGLVETLDPDYPEAEAIAVKDGKVLAVGEKEDIDAFVGKNTETIDLEGYAVLPGFFTMSSDLIRTAYSSFGQPLDGNASEAEILVTLKAYVSKNPKARAYLAFGFYDGLTFGDSPRTLLDAISPKKPLAVLSASGNSAIVNSAALTAAHDALLEEVRAMQETEQIKLVPQGNSTAADAVLRTRTEEGIDVESEFEDDEEDGFRETDTLSLEEALKVNPWILFRDILPGFQYFGHDENGLPTGFLEGPATVSQFLNILGSMDPDPLSKAIVKASCAYAKKGYTTLLDAGSPDYFVRSYMSATTELIENGFALQRSTVTTLVQKEIDSYLALQRMAQKQTLCVECADSLSASHLRFDIRTDKDGNATLSPAYLESYATSALDHGFDVLAVCDGLPAAKAAEEGLSGARDKARKGKLVVQLSGLSEEEEAELRDAFDTDEIPVIGTPKTPSQVIGVLTGRQRHLLRDFETSGVIAAGSYADFAVLAHSPYANGEAEDPLSIPVKYTVLGGRIVSTDPDDYELPSFDFGEFEEE